VMVKPITDECRSCGRVFTFDVCQGAYLEALEVPLIIPPASGIRLEECELDIILWICPDDGSVIAVDVQDVVGDTVFTPANHII
jgi:hypothetical protein